MAVAIEAGSETLGSIRLTDRALETSEHLLPVVRGVGVLERPGETVPAVEVETDRFGVEGRPVLELDAVPQLERPNGSLLRALPTRRKRRDDLERSRLQIDQPFGDLIEHTQRCAVRDERAIERDRVAFGAYDESRGLRIVSRHDPCAGARTEDREHCHNHERQEKFS